METILAKRPRRWSRPSITLVAVSTMVVQYEFDSQTVQMSPVSAATNADDDGIETLVGMDQGLEVDDGA